MMTKQKKLLAAAGVVVLVGGGWAFAKHQATSIAKDQVDGYIIRHNLGGKVTYEDLSASPFGSATLSGVRVRLSPTNSVTIASLEVSNVEMKYDQLRGITVAAHGAQVPLLAIAKEEGSNDKLTRDLIGMGYVTLTGDVGASVRYDDQRGTLALESTGDVKEAGSWKARLSFANVDPSAMNVVYGLSNISAEANAFAMLAAAGQGLHGLASLSISGAEVSVDNSGIYKRDQQVTDKDLPPDSVTDTARGPAGDEMEMVKAGMAPSEAHAAHEAVEAWLRKGGTLKAVTNLSQPLLLFRNGNFFTPAFDGPLGFLAAAKVRISS